MQTDILSIGLGFLEGLALIISPCILPILPIILAGSLTGSKRRPIGIIIGFVCVFALFTFFSRALVQYVGIDTNLIRHIAYVLLLLFAIMMMSTYLTEKFNLMTQRLMNVGASLSEANNAEGGLKSGIVFGSLIAIIWTPCAGPILAAVIVQTVLQQTNWMGFFTVVAFGIGAAVPMLVIALFGRTIMTRLSVFKHHAVFFRKMLGVVIMVSVFYMMYAEGGIGAVQGAETTVQTSHTLQDGLPHPYPAPALGGIDAWINSPPLELSALKGKVVLIDFWTYSCINCLRTLPYLKNWYEKYHNNGLVIIGVHTPEFDFEKNINNIKNAVAREGIKYPVAVDSQFVTWQNFNNQYWPAHYLIDKKGEVVYTHFGEGEYDVTENNIRYLLGITGDVKPEVSRRESFFESITPETYLGYARANAFSSNEAAMQNAPAIYTFPSSLGGGQWALQGGWTILSDRIVSSQNNAAIKLHFHARKVFMVMGTSSDKSIDVSVLMDNKPLVRGKGVDVMNGHITVNKHRLYEIVSLDQVDSGVLQVISSAPGLEIYTFTFGG